MRLADLRLAVRPRTPYEAMDLGIRLVQDEAALLWRTWFLVTLPVLALVLLVTFHFESSSASLLLWWLKPLFDFALLGVLSRRVFGDTPTRRNILGVLAGSWRHGLAGHLTWRRFSMSRAYLLPVWLLENLPRREREARIALLRNQYTGRARWLHAVMVHFEAFLMVTVLSLLFWFAPDSQDLDLWALLSGNQTHPLVNVITTVAYFIAMSVVEPFYVAAGFTLYLNRRTDLEAWDLEIAFRHLRERLDTHRRLP
jgi:hypothetical protein